MAESWSSVHVEWNFPKGRFVTAGAGYAIPSRIEVTAESADVKVTVHVEIDEGRAWSRKVNVESSGPRGVTSTTLRSVPIRALVAGGVTSTLARVEINGDTAHITPITKWTDADREVARRIVGYVEVSR